MAEANRSLSACLRCRKQKLKCGGPGRVPCQRCRASNAECVFVAPKAARSVRASEGPADASFGGKLSHLEQRLDLMEERHHMEMQRMQRTLVRMAVKLNLSPGGELSSPAESTAPGPSVHGDAAADIVSRGLVSEKEWQELYSFYYENCRTVIGFVDDQIYPPDDLLRYHPLLSTTICVIAARAIRPEKYQTYLADADELIKNTFAGPTPDINTAKALMLLSAWTGRTRLWGYVASIAAELGLNTAALQLHDDTVEQTVEAVERARTWFTLCCFDLVLNLTRPFVINRMRDYLPFARRLLSSPYCRPVDHRICAYIDGFAIAANAKAQFPKSQLQINPISPEAANHLTSFDQQLDNWFYQINNNIEPLYQTFATRQDRNRFLVPYLYMKLYINGFALHGVGSPSDTPDESRLAFIQRALDSANLLLQTQFESDDFRSRLRYSIDYNGSPIYQSVNFILKAVTVAHKYINYGKVQTALRQAVQMFEEAGALDAANEIRREQEKVAILTQIVLSPLEYESAISGPGIEEGALLDIPNFLDGATWDEPFPTLSVYMLD